MYIEYLNSSTYDHSTPTSPKISFPPLLDSWSRIKDIKSRVQMLNLALELIQFDTFSDKNLRQALLSEMNKVKQNVDKGMRLIATTEPQLIHDGSSSYDSSTLRSSSISWLIDTQEVLSSQNEHPQSRHECTQSGNIADPNELSQMGPSRRRSLVRGPRDLGSSKTQGALARRHTQYHASSMSSDYAATSEILSTFEDTPNPSMSHFSITVEPSFGLSGSKGKHLMKPSLRVDTEYSVRSSYYDNLPQPVTPPKPRKQPKPSRSSRRTSAPPSSNHKRSMSESMVAPSPSKRHKHTTLQSSAIAEALPPPPVSSVELDDDCFGSLYGGFNSAEEAQAFVAEQREKYELLSLTNIIVQHVPEQEKKEYGENFDILFSYVLDVENNLELNAHTLAREDVRRLIAVCVTTRHQKTLLTSKDPMYIWDLKAVRLMTKQMKITASDDFRPQNQQ